MSVVKNIVSRLDGWMNLFTGQGVSGKDKQLKNEYGRDLKLADVTLEALYHSEGIARRAVELINGTMIREWFEVNGDPDGAINKYLSKLKIKSFTGKALAWADVFGGSCMVLGLDDGGEFKDPLDENKLKNIEFIRVYDRRRVTWSPTDLYSDPEESKYGEPEYYEINPVNSTSSGPYKVHESRVIMFDGRDVTDNRRVENSGWGGSIYDSTFKQLANLGGVEFSAKGIIDDFIQTIIKINNLAELLANDEEQQIRTRLDIMDLSRHLMNTTLIDKDEEFSKVSASVSGLDKLMDKFATAVSSVFGIPLTLLMGQSPAGMNSTGKSDLTQWYDKIGLEQEMRMLEQMNRIVCLVQLCSEGPAKGKLIEDWSIEFLPLWKPTQKEISETRKNQAETDSKYISSGVLMAEEVATSRFGGNEYSMETILDESLDRENIKAEPEDDFGKDSEEPKE